jgi:hypothetical protein
MKRRSVLLKIAMIIIVLNLIDWIYNSIQYRDFPLLISKPESVEAYIIAWGWLGMFLTHLFIIIQVIFSLKYSHKYFKAGLALLITSVISIIFLLLHFVGVIESFNEYPQGYPIDGLIQMVWTAQFVHLAFLLFALIYLAIIQKNSTEKLSVFRDQLFIALHITGIVCSFIGLLWLLMYFTFNAKHHLRSYDFVPFAITILPYIVVLCSWIIAVFTDKRPLWLDEKQRSDINSAGMISLLVPLPLIFALIINEYYSSSGLAVFIDGTINILWMPLYLFLAILSFSVVALYKFRNFS